MSRRRSREQMRPDQGSRLMSSRPTHPRCPRRPRFTVTRARPSTTPRPRRASPARARTPPAAVARRRRPVDAPHRHLPPQRGRHRQAQRHARRRGHVLGARARPPLRHAAPGGTTGIRLAHPSSTASPRVRRVLLGFVIQPSGPASAAPPSSRSRPWSGARRRRRGRPGRAVIEALGAETRVRRWLQTR
jgi:hypothetical protein